MSHDVVSDLDDTTGKDETCHEFRPSEGIVDLVPTFVIGIYTLHNGGLEFLRMVYNKINTIPYILRR